MAIKPKISIGMPVYNGESTIQTALDSLLSQTFTNFELIISDNGSTDSTQKICEKYRKKDDRIQYLRYNKTKNIMWNFWNVLEKVKSNYFMWAAADDIWDSYFIEKNLKILESNIDIVGSISNVEFFGRNINPEKPELNFNLYNELIKNQPKNVSYEERASFFMRHSYGMNTYSLFRTDKLKKSFIHHVHPAVDGNLILNILKYGDLHIIDEVLMYRSAKGTTSAKTDFEIYKRQGISSIWRIFPYIPFTFFALTNVGIKFFIKELPYLTKLNFISSRDVIRSLIKRKYLH